MYSGGVNGRLLGACWLAVAMCAFAGGDALAEKPKEPGFFNPKRWIPGSGSEREEVRRLTPDGAMLVSV